MKLFISDIKSIFRVPVLLCILLSPVIILLFLQLCLPLISKLTGTENPETYGSFYPVTAIALICAIPFIYGLLFSFVHIYRPFFNNKDSSEISGARSRLMLSRIPCIFIFSFIMILPVIYVTDPVPTEGWVRSIYASILLSVTAPFIFLFLAAFGSTRGRWTILATISFVFLLALPSGMMLHHPWNYIAFFSPFYWSGWAWVIASPVEAVMYGSISAGVTAAGSIIFYRCIPVTES